MNSVRPFYVYHHLFLTNDWKALFSDHLDALSRSGCLANAVAFRVGVNFADEEDLAALVEMLRPVDRAEIVFSRDVGRDRPYELPVRLRTGGRPSTSIDIGEAETVLAMCDFARRMTGEADFLFLHAKGVTNPPLRTRTIRQFNAIADMFGVPRPTSSAEANRLAHRSIVHIIKNWRNILSQLESCSYYYFVWNIFAARGSLVRNFDWDSWFSPDNVSRFSNHRFTALTDRHAFAGFPVKIESIVAKRPIAPIGRYFNCTGGPGD